MSLKSFLAFEKLFLVILLSSVDVSGHGRLMDPPSRASMWRMGFKTPKNYNDNQLYCGGLSYQKKMNGKCGVCGDPYGGRREHEAGGKYATGTISKSYSMGQVIEAKVDITANHKGNFIFKICPNNDPNHPVTQECLDNYPLMSVTQGSYTYNLNSRRNKMFKVKLQLPDGLTCSQCVLQWVYTAGNNWGVCSNGKGRLGCGAQEQFRGCADVAIEAQGSEHHPITLQPPVQPGYPKQPSYPFDTDGVEHTHTHEQEGEVVENQPEYTTQFIRPTFTPRPYRPHQTFKPYQPHQPRYPYKPNKPQNPVKPYQPKKPGQPIEPYQPKEPIYPKEAIYPVTKKYPVHRPTKPSWQHKRPTYGKICKAVGIWSPVPGMNKWCSNNCNRGYCPATHCKC